MTLVLNVLTPECVIQVSDRRLVWLQPGSSIRRTDDERNKAVVWCGRLAFAYSGLAELGQERRTDTWLARRLAEIETAPGPSTETRDQGDLLTALAERSTAYFQGPRISRVRGDLRRHAFVAVGWARFNREAGPSAYLAVISNFHDEAWRDLATAQPAFQRHVRRLQSDEAFVFPIGYSLTTRELDQLAAQLQKVDHDPTAILEILANKVRAVAATTPTVGRGLMANVLPRTAIPSEDEEHLAVLGPPRPELQTFLYIPPGEDPPGQAYGPTHVCGGMVMSNFTVTPL